MLIIFGRDADRLVARLLGGQRFHGGGNRIGQFFRFASTAFLLVRGVGIAFAGFPGQTCIVLRPILEHPVGSDQRQFHLFVLMQKQGLVCIGMAQSAAIMIGSVVIEIVQPLRRIKDISRAMDVT